MAQNAIARAVRPGRFLGLDAVDWFVLIGGVTLVGVLALLV